MILDLPEETRRARQPFLLEGGRMRQIGVLCIHGFTGSPAEMRPLGDFLAERGYTVVGPLLPQHGGMAHELKGAKWQEWTGAAQTAYEQLASRCDSVFIVGLSMGGLIAMHLAAKASDAQQPHAASYVHRRNGKAPLNGSDKLKGIIVMAAPAAINDPRARAVRYARYFVPYYYPLKDIDFSDSRMREYFKQRLPNGVQLDFDDPETVKAVKRSVRIPLGAIHELMQLNERVVKELPRITLPALFMQGRKDNVVAPDSADILASRVGSHDKRVIWYENSAHELPLEPDSGAMFAEIDRFIRTHTNYEHET
jgi:carboxylesterase